MSLASSKSINILCDENTYLNSRNFGVRFKTDLEREHVKGKTEKIAIFMPLRDSVPIQRDSKSEIVIPTVALSDVIGREEILNKIEKSVNGYLKEKFSESQVILLQAETGMGITTLFRYAVQCVEQMNSRSKSINIFQANSDEYERYTPMFLWREIMKQYLEMELWKKKISRKNSKKESSTISFNNFASSLKEEWKEYLPLLNDLYCFPDSIIPDNKFTSELVGEKRYEATCFFLKHFFEKQPFKIMFVLKDIQWIDKHSLSLLSDILSESSNIFILCSMKILGFQQQEEVLIKDTIRNKFHKIQTYTLEPLTSKEIKKIMQNTLKCTNFPKELEKFVESSQGNPHFGNNYFFVNI